MAIGCQPAVDTSESDRVQLLEQENAELQRQLEASQAGEIQKATLLNDIKKTLEEITGKTVELRRLQNELEPATFATKTDLKDQIFSSLESLQQSLENGRAKAEQAATGAGELAVDPEVLAGLKNQLDEKEREIADLHDRMTILEQEAIRYRERLEEDRAERHAVAANLIELRRQLERNATRDLEPFKSRQAVPEKRARPVQPFGDWRPSREGAALFEGPSRRRRDARQAYYFIGTREQIEGAFHRGEILSHRGTYHVPESALIAGGPPRSFRRTGTDQGEIPLGFGLRNGEVVSVHRWKENLFELVEYENGAAALRIEDPFAFWELGRYLIIEARTGQSR